MGGGRGEVGEQKPQRAGGFLKPKDGGWGASGGGLIRNLVFGALATERGVSVWVDAIRTPPLENLRDVPRYICSLHAERYSYLHINMFASLHLLS